jgi:hypothetical protein
LAKCNFATLSPFANLRICRQKNLAQVECGAAGAALFTLEKYFLNINIVRAEQFLIFRKSANVLAIFSNAQLANTYSTN